MSTQTAVHADTPDGAARPGMVHRIAAVLNIFIATALCLTPFTAVIVLGWMMRVMRREIVIESGRYSRANGKRDVSRKAALMTVSALPELAATARFPGWVKGFWDTLLSSLKAAIAVSLALLPFGTVLLLSWWAGWENSFNKGYEQAWVGPLLAAVGIALGAFTLVHLPMALAHHAAEQRVGAIWSIGLIHRLIGRVRWRYLMLTLATVALSAPLFLVQILPTFMESIYPGLATASPEEFEAFALFYYAGATAYLVLVLLVLRRWAARLYARAALLHQSNELQFIRNVSDMLDRPAAPARPAPGRFGGIIAGLLMLACWLAFVAALYVAQFANHAWWNWISFPLTGLPWIFRPL
ncbi:MAG: hypothetical protein AAGA00_04700 [Pseudomonadota bacterium]